MRKKKRVVAMLLAMSMSIALLPAEAWAAKGNNRQEATTEVAGQEDVDNQYHRLETTPDGQIVDGTDKWETFQIPDIIEKGEVKEKGYIGRVREEEKDLNTFVFQNSDGSNTMRIYDYPVKYVDENGDIRDITTDIGKCTDGAYVTKDNTIKTRFPKYFREGIELTSDNVNIQLVPKGMDNASKFASKYVPVFSLDDKTVSYSYGTNTTLEYELTYTGFKEDIVVSEYTGQTEYEFTIHTNGLYLSEEDGSYYLVDDEGTVQATIGDIIIFTADEANNTMGSMTSVTVEDGQEYLLTIHVDGEYLKDEKTVYPIRIDPTIEVNYDNNGAGAIEDVTLNENSGSSGTSGSLYVGKRSTYGKSRTLMKFPTLNLSSVYSESYITSATVEIRDLLCQSTAMTVQCYVFNGNTWSESSANWSNVSPSSYTTLLSSNSISYANGAKQSTAHRYKFDITAAVKGWKSGTYTQAKGIMFKAADSVENGSTYLYKTFGSYNRASYKPSLTVVYNDYSNVSLSMNGNYVMVGQSKNINVNKFPTNLSIMWQSEDRTIATVNGNVVTGVSRGTVKISATYRDLGTGNYVTKSIYITVLDTIGLVDGESYNIMNYSSGKYMSLVSETDSNGVNICTMDKTDLDIAQWKIIHEANKKYQFINLYSTTNKVLSSMGVNVCLYMDSNYSSQQFDVYRVEKGKYQGLYMIRYGNYFLSQDTSGNVCLSNVINDRAYWSFMLAANGEASIFSMNYKGFDTRGSNTCFYETMKNCGYIEHRYIGEEVEVALKSLKEDEIFIFTGHGEPATIVFHDLTGESAGVITVNRMVNSTENSGYIWDLEDNELSQLRCVLLMGCNTGVSAVLGNQSVSLLNAMYNKGAHFVMGTTKITYVDRDNVFLGTFLKCMKDGENIKTCMEQAISEVGYRLWDDGLWDYYPLVYIGDTEQYLKN